MSVLKSKYETINLFDSMKKENKFLKEDPRHPLDLTLLSRPSKRFSDVLI